jgi:hypothetical protein
VYPDDRAERGHKLIQRSGIATAHVEVLAVDIRLEGEYVGERTVLDVNEVERQ